MPGLNIIIMNVRVNGSFDSSAMPFTVLSVSLPVVLHAYIFIFRGAETGNLIPSLGCEFFQFSPKISVSDERKISEDFKLRKIELTKLHRIKIWKMKWKIYYIVHHWENLKFTGNAHLTSECSA